MRDIRYNVTLREFLHARNSAEEDVDVSVDGFEFCIAVCFGDINLTPKGEEQFKRCLDEIYIDEYIIVSKQEEDYDEDNNNSRLLLACDFLKALAGYCAQSDYEEWFEGEDAKLI